MKIDLCNYYDIGEVSYWTTSVGVKMFDIELISKSTGEIITWSFTEEIFDKFLEEMEENVKFLKDEVKFIKEQKWWFL